MNKAIMVALIAAAGAAAGAAAAISGQGDGGGLTASALMEGASPRLGSASAPITIVEFGDYQCTYCYRFHQSTLELLQEKYIDAGRASLVFRDFPLNGPDSVLAAEATRCAGEQGMYWEYHDILYKSWAGERTGWITRPALDGFASQAGLDAGPFASCLDSQRHRQAVADGYAAAQELGIGATPSFVILGDGRAVKITGNQPAEVFERVIAGLGGGGSGQT